MYHDDRLLRQLRRWIEFGNRRIIPRLDVAQENLGQGVAVKLEIARLHAIEVDDRHVSANDGRKLNKS